MNGHDLFLIFFIIIIQDPNQNRCVSYEKKKLTQSFFEHDDDDDMAPTWLFFVFSVLDFVILKRPVHNNNQNQKSEIEKKIAIKTYHDKKNNKNKN